MEAIFIIYCIGYLYAIYWYTKGQTDKVGAILTAVLLVAPLWPIFLPIGTIADYLKVRREKTKW